MKYIRTKDGTVIDYSIVIEKNIRHLFVENGKFIDFNSGGRYEIIKQADTIKELCDEFVVVYEDGARIVYGDLEWAKTKAKSSLEIGNKSVIYGAIWTDYGLIYRAKMKGILPNGEIDWELF